MSFEVTVINGGTYVSSLLLITQSCPTLCDPTDYSPTGSSVCPLAWDSPSKNTGVGCHALLQGIFPTQGLNLSLPVLQADSSLSEPPGKPPYSFPFCYSAFNILNTQPKLELLLKDDYDFFLEEKNNRHFDWEKSWHKATEVDRI